MRALARSDGSAERGRARSAPSRCAATSTTRDSMRRRRRGLRGRLPPRRPPRRLGALGGVRARQRDRHAQRARGVPRDAGVRRFVHCGTEAALMAGEPLVERRRDRAAAARLEGALPARPRRSAEQAVRAANRRGLRDGRRAAALRLGRGRHHAAADDRRDGRDGPLRLDRRRPPPDRDDPRRQRRRGPACSAAERGAPGEAYFVTDGEPVVFREFVSELLADAGRRAARPHDARAGWRGAAGRGRARPPGGCCRCPARRRSRRFAPGSPPRSARSTSPRRARELGYEPVISREEGLAELRAAA